MIPAGRWRVERCQNAPVDQWVAFQGEGVRVGHGQHFATWAEAMAYADRESSRPRAEQP